MTLDEGKDEDKEVIFLYPIVYGLSYPCGTSNLYLPKVKGLVIGGKFFFIFFYYSFKFH